MLTADLPIAGLQIVQAQITVAPGRREGWHVHAGTLVEHVVGGDMTLELQDTPTKVLTAGQSVLIDTGVNGRRVRAVRPSATGRPPLTTGGKVPDPD